MRTFWQDIRYAVRMLGKNRGFTAVAVLSLTLGIGGATTIFSVLNPVVLRPLPFKDPDRLVAVWETRLAEGQSQQVAPRFSTALAWREQSRTVEQIVMARELILDRPVLGKENTEMARVQDVGPGFFELLGVEPILGRTFRPEDFGGSDLSTGIVLSESYWRRQFEGNPEILGRSLRISGQAKVVVGVAPDFHTFPWVDRVDFWWAIDISKRPDQRSSTFRFLARLKPGVTPEVAAAELDMIRQRLVLSQDASVGATDVRIEPLRAYSSKRHTGVLYLLFGAVGFVLLIACANVASLLLGRSVDRRKEIAIRTALGASRLRLVRQVAAESLVLALVGGSLGVLLAVWGIQLFVSLAPNFYPPTEQIRIDGAVLKFSLMISVLTGFLFGAAPALQLSKARLGEFLKAGGRQSNKGNRQGTRRLLVVCEVGLALLLLVGAGVMVRSLIRIDGLDRGFSPEGVLSMKIWLRGPQYGMRVSSNDQRVTPLAVLFYEQLMERIANLPGVHSVGGAGTFPTQGVFRGGPFRIQGHPSPPPGEEPVAAYAEVTEDFFRALRVPLLKGRWLTERDTQESEAVALINETMARQFFAGQDPVGKVVLYAHSGAGGRTVSDPPRRIVGVVGDIVDTFRESPGPAIYVPYRQHPWSYPSASIIHTRKWIAIRTGTDPARLAPAVRGLIAELDEDQVVTEVMTLESRVSAESNQERLGMRVMVIFACVAVFLAAVGLYGVISYSVSSRTQEFGIRMALGAERANVLKIVGKEVLELTLAGVAMGIIAAMGLTRFLESQLHGVSPTDPATFCVVSILLVSVAAVACYFPARRATRIDPLVALRYE